MKKTLYIVPALVVGILVVVVFREGLFMTGEVTSQDSGENVEQLFIGGGLKTNTSISDIDLSEVVSGLPSKDRIPALTDPNFVSVENANEFVSDETLGIFIENNEDRRFYPYNILVWHEIVNDIVGGVPMVVTFCPLCGTAIVYDPVVSGKRVQFGVSGKLHESNLLMYDRETESLWSQALGKAVVGDNTGLSLEQLPFQLLKYGEAKEKYPNLNVLDVNTGHTRDYTLYPYGSYESNEQFYFQVSQLDERLPAKEIIYAFTVNDADVALQIEALEEGKNTISIGENDVEVIREGGEITVVDPTSHTKIAGYYSMWFSWATYHRDGVVWPEA